MYLEKLEIQGFKSFANKNTLIFPGMLDADRRGITAVVGPNGSGKSNVADSVRWVLGEQSMKTLRGKKSEDVIFSGSDKKGKLGMAEVSMHLNNEDGAKAGASAIDYSQIVVTRRLYRNGDSEYMINNSRVRLSDIQMLLARAKFGQRTYSVIGQGMVEGFLNTSLSERKEFFDEATGVKQYQIKRDDSLNKLRSSYENLAQAQMLLQEIEPRLRSLTRQVGRLHKRGELETGLRDLQIDYYGRLWRDISGNFKKYNQEYLELEQVKFAKEKKLEALNRSLELMKLESGQDNEFNELQAELSRLQSEKDKFTRQLAKAEAQMETQLEAVGQHDVSFLLNRKDVLSKDLEKLELEFSSLRSSGDGERRKIEELKNAKSGVDSEIRNLEAELLRTDGKTDDDNVKNANRLLHKILEDLEEAETISEFQKIKDLALRIKKDLEELKKIMSGNAAQDEAAAMVRTVQLRIGKLSQEKEALVNEINENNLVLSRGQERGRMLGEKRHSLESELKDIVRRLEQSEKKIDFKELGTEQARLKSEIAALDILIAEVRKKVSSLSAKEEEKRRRLFALQRDLQELQNELNDNNSRMQGVKINSTRFETRLEDLENEIRRELGDLNQVKKSKAEESGQEGISVEALREKISQIKKQLELIGGIDPQIENEYNETKERFDFLNGQVTDFSSAVDSLRKIIKELDIVIKEQFDKEFKLIAANFEKYFKILFNGGNAKIVKVLEESMDEPSCAEASEGKTLEIGGDSEKKTSALAALPDLNKIKYLQKYNATGLAGIEIQATPPGKKIASISMLSGGERALTAIALICAIISSNPSPFVILDEVDAALDEANSERLAKILDELSHKTQFIVITHNRASMRRANILYGVTMGDDGVSKLLSVKLEEVKSVIKN